MAVTPKFTIVDKDHGYAAMQSLVARIGRMRQATVTVGIQGANASRTKRGRPRFSSRKSKSVRRRKRSGAALTVAEVGAIHEFGSGRIPKRSFIKGTIDQQRAQILRRMEIGGEGVLTGKLDQRTAMELIGEYTVGRIKQRMANGISPANAPSTIARKGSSTPLVDTGQLRNSITYEVHE